MPFVYAGQWGPDAFTDSYGNVLVGATLTVYNANTLVAATLYTDQTKGTVGLNPVSPDPYGNFLFWANPGVYDLAVNYQGQVVQSLKGMLVYTNPQETAGAAVPDGSITGGPAAIGVKLAQTTITHDNVAIANRDGVVGTPSMRTIGTGALQAAAGSHAAQHRLGAADPLSLRTNLSVFGVPGVISVTTGTMRLPIDGSYTITSIRAMVGTAPTGSSIIVDVLKNGTTIYTTPGNRPTIAAAGTASTPTVPDTTGLVAGDYLTVNIAQVGSTTPGQDLAVVITVDRTA